MSSSKKQSWSFLVAIQNGIYNIVIPQGTTFSLSLDLDINLTGLGVRAQLAKHLHPTSPRTSFTAFIQQPASQGIIIVGLNSDVTSMLTPNIRPQDALKIENWDTHLDGIEPHEVDLLIPGRKPYFWDLEVYDSSPENVVNRFLTGYVLVTSGVTVSND
jgi:hypothetical protein